MRRRSAFDMAIVPRGAIPTIAISFLVLGLVLGFVLGAALEAAR